MFIVFSELPNDYAVIKDLKCFQNNHFLPFLHPLLNPVWGADQRQQPLWSERSLTCLQNPSEDFPMYN